MKKMTHNSSGRKMMTLSLALIAGLAFSAPGLAQEDMRNLQIEMKQMEKELGQAAVEIQHALDEAGIQTGIKISVDDEGSDRPKLGVYLSDMDFEDAYKMRYPYAHGALVDGTTRGGNAERAGLIEGDIIMFFDGKKVLYEDHLVRMIRTKQYGDVAQVVFWRDEAKDSTMVTFAEPEKDVQSEAKIAVVEEEEEKKKRKHSRGWGGGGFTPMIVQDNFQEVNDLLSELGLNSTPFKADGVVLWGGSGQGYVGNGWFLGGFGNGVSKSTVVPEIKHTTTGEKVERAISVSMGLGGVTIEKRFAPFSFAVIGGGLGLGGGGVDLKVIQKDGNFAWDDSLSNQLIDTKSTSVSFSKGYFIAHPRVNVMLRLTSWLRLRAEYGYLYGYSGGGWTTKLGAGTVEDNFDEYEFGNSQDKLAELGSPTVSLGLWFGF